MTANPPTTLTFFVMGVSSGFCTAGLAMIPPCGLIVPGIAFGIALAAALQSTGVPMSAGRCAMLIAGSTLAYFAAILASLVTFRLLSGWLGNGLLSGACIGALGGWVGAVGVALAVILVVEEMNVVLTLFLVSITGAWLECLLVTLSIYLADHLSVRREIRFLIEYPVWQAGVAVVIGWCRCLPAEVAEG